MTYGTLKWRPWVLDEINSRAFFRKAIDLGISFFDTADIYSLGVREESRAALSGRWRTCSDDEQRPS